MAGSSGDNGGSWLLVGLSQIAGGLEKEDEGENDCGENEEMTARSLFIDFAG